MKKGLIMHNTLSSNAFKSSSSRNDLDNKDQPQTWHMLKDNDNFAKDVSKKIKNIVIYVWK